VWAVCVALGAIAVELFLPLLHVALAAVSLDQPVKVIHASATAFRALDTKHVELALDVTEDEIVAVHGATSDGVVDLMKGFSLGSLEGIGVAWKMPPTGEMFDECYGRW
jgi:hypothetical protein